MTFEEFVRDNNIVLNRQQLEAVQAVDGPVLLLAVPGSGKTTVLVARIGYMVKYLGIPASRILTLTYTRAAAADMKARYEDLLGPGSGVEFRTINGICAKIIEEYSRRTGKQAFSIVDDRNVIQRIISGIYQDVSGEFPAESDISNVETDIAYIKNMMLDSADIKKLGESHGYNLTRMYELYNKYLVGHRLMDYDDQMVYAKKMLETYPVLLEMFQKQYQYICVDEAQDTSRIQHEIIAMLARDNENLFMVGDEDQSIYGFRAAYPEALLEFEANHPGARVMLMETNYRSTGEIVEAAGAVISNNRSRRQKNMTASRDASGRIDVVKINTRKDQLEYLLKVAENCTEETAVLYRYNESVIPLVDLLERNNIPYRMRNRDAGFFTSRIVTDVKMIYRFARNPKDAEAFMRIYSKIDLYINRQIAEQGIRISREKGIGILDAILTYASIHSRTRETIENTDSVLRSLEKLNALSAIRSICKELGYENRMIERKVNTKNLEILKFLCEHELKFDGLMNRLDELQTVMKNKKMDADAKFILSTIHSSKGLEYDNVYLLDVIDGVFPETIPAEFSGKRKLVKTLRVTSRDIRVEADTANAFEEERRIFYVGITRARNSLHILRTAKGSVFIDELSGNRSAVEPAGSAKTTQRGPIMSSSEFLTKLRNSKRIKHRTLGNAEVVCIDDKYIVVRLDNSGEDKKLNLEFCRQHDIIEVIK